MPLDNVRLSMKRPLLSLALLLLAITGARAQFGSFGDVPIEINAEETRVEHGIAIAEHDVVIRHADVVIYCDYARYNPDTRDVLVQGNVRLFREGQQFIGERAVYNLETKALQAAEFRGEFTPGATGRGAEFYFTGSSLSTLGSNAYLVRSGAFTTSDSSKPDFTIRANTVRVYPNDRIVFQNARLYVGQTPIFWFPYLYQSLNKEQGFLFTPGYSSVLGAHLLTEYTFPLAENMSGKLRLDLMSQRGVGVGFDARWDEAGGGAGQENSLASATEARSQADEREHKEGKGWGRFRSYLVEDSNPGINKTALARETIDSTRYRVSLQDRTYWTQDIYSSINFNKLSDRRFLQDFEPSEFRQDPNPDNVFSLTKWDEDGTFTITARKQINTQFDTTEKLPEGALDVKQLPIFGQSGLFYQGETSAGYLRRNFASDSKFPDYETFRGDTFHQISFPKTVGGWLSLVPKAGVRGTYYNEGGFTALVPAVSETEDVRDPKTGLLTFDKHGNKVTTTTQVSPAHEALTLGDPQWRGVVNAGLEASFKFSRAYESAQSRFWGLDGLRHVVQPYMDASFTRTNEDPAHILQFDRLERSTQLPPIDFPQFNTIDSIDNWSIVRLGVRNRLQTRRDNLTFSWLELDTFFDINIDRPDFGNFEPLADTGTFSNLFNRLRWYPLPWVTLQVDSQLPVFDHGFTEVNTTTTFLVTEDVRLSIGHRYISGDVNFFDSNLMSFGGYVRLGENWGVGFSEAYEFQTSILEAQNYQVYRDLSSWVASLGVSVRDNGGVKKAGSNSLEEIGLLLTFTLKDIPGVRLPIPISPSDVLGGAGTGKNR